jgi:hypothetical protein
MHAAAEGHSTLGIPKKVGEEYDEADPGHDRGNSICNRKPAKAFGVETKTTGLMIAIKPDSDDMLAKFRDGTLTGFSIGGPYNSLLCSSTNKSSNRVG